MGINSSRLTSVKTFLIRIEGLKMLMEGTLEITITINTYLKCLTLQHVFIVIDMAIAYNVIIGRSFKYKISATINT